MFWQDLISLWRDMLILKTTKKASMYLDLTDHEAQEMRRVADRFRKETLLYHCKLLEDALFAMQKANSVKRIVAEMTLVRLCDESLDMSPEAILSRIACLEEQMITGRPIAAKTEAVKTVEAAPLKEEAEPKPTPKATPSTKGTEKRVLHPVRNWMEVVERVSRSAPMTASFVKASRAFTTEDAKVIVRFDNDFAMRMMEQDEARDRLRAAVSAILRREVGDRELIFEASGRSEDRSLIDEIIESTEEF